MVKGRVGQKQGGDTRTHTCTHECMHAGGDQGSLRGLCWPEHAVSLDASKAGLAAGKLGDR